MNEQNLIKNEDLTPSQRRANASKAGKASAEARKRKKDLKECLEILLTREITSKNGELMTGSEAISAKLFEQALHGNIKAFEVIRDSTGQKPTEKVIVSSVNEESIDRLQEAIKKRQNNE